MNEIRVQDTPLDPYAEIELLRSNDPGIGGIVSFIGLMRDFNEDKRIESLKLEYYPGMTEKALRKIVAEADMRWELLGCRVIHRVGEMIPTDAIVLVAVASTHRGEAFEACEFIIDFLKTRAPFWKKEQTSDGGRWVAARRSDITAEKKWS
jgi:molybdopterin synthase catalytic subunit